MRFYVVIKFDDAAFFGSKCGANLVEYLLLVSLIAIAVMGAVLFLGSQLSPKFSQAGSQISGASGP